MNADLNMDIPENVALQPPVQPQFDTWRVQNDSGWVIEPRVPPNSNPSELNAWYALAAADFLRSFGPWVRPWKFVAYVPATETHEKRHLNYTWKMGESPSLFIDQTLQHIREIPDAIYDLTLSLDMYVWFRSAESPCRPTRAWLRTHTDLQVAGPDPNRDAFLSLSIGHNLFAFSTWQSGENEELHALNQPLLEDGLRRWEQIAGNISEVDGVDVFKYGFRTPAAKSLA
jgi:hypothetical protein